MRCRHQARRIQGETLSLIHIFQVVNATEVIATEEPPVNAIRKKKDSSIVVGLNLVKQGEADAFVSAGSSGALLVGGQVIVGRSKGVERPPLAPLIPTEKGVSLLIDCGANVDARASHLVQFAQMGSIYMEHVMGIKNPRVAIVNIGAEEEKGNALVKETFPLLKECKGINFTGSIEAREIPHGGADVIVCEAFVGNVILKLYEGVGATLISMVTVSYTHLDVYKRQRQYRTAHCNADTHRVDNETNHRGVADCGKPGFSHDSSNDQHIRKVVK